MSRKARDQIALELNPKKAKGSKRAPTSKLRWQCSRCGVVLVSWASAERHIDQEHRAGRLDLLDLYGRDTDRGG